MLSDSHKVSVLFFVHVAIPYRIFKHDIVYAINKR